jgi:hypothetical protein
MRRDIYGADTIFSTFTGDDSTFLCQTSGFTYFRRCSFRDFQLSEGIFDVSSGSSVRLENCTFTNITVPRNDYVSTTYDDGDTVYFQTFQTENYPEDDADPLFDVERRRANHSSLPEEGVPFLERGGAVVVMLVTCHLNLTVHILISMMERGGCRGGHKD